jgi:dephospho-CoA kinase
MKRVALTGSIGMGKSTTLGFFRDAGIPVHSADETVHALYAGPAAPLIEAAFPGTVRDGVVDRQSLSRLVVGNEKAMKRLEAIIHPLVREQELSFSAAAEKSGAALAVFDIPLLFETGRSEMFDAIVVVSAPADLQRQRVLERPGMTAEKFEAILARQIPDALKRAKATYVIETGTGLESARNAVNTLIRELSGSPEN